MRRFLGLSLTGISLATTALGFLGQLLLYRFYGAGPELDLYFYSMALPVFIAGQVALVFSYYLVPFLSRSEPSENALLRLGLTKLLILIGLLLAVPGIALAPLMGPATPSDIPPALPWVLCTLAWTSVLISNITAAQAGFLNAQSSFVLPALFPLVAQIGAVALILGFHEGGVAVPLLGLNTGFLLAALLGAWALRRHASQLSGGTVLSFDGLREAGRFFRSANYLPLTLSVFSAHFFIDSLMASRLDTGSLSVLSLAHRVCIAAMSLVVSVFAGYMSKDMAAYQSPSAEATQTLHAHLKRVFFFGAATCVFLVANSDHLAQLLLHGGKTDSASVLQLGQIIRILGVASLPMLLGQFLMRGLLALHQHKLCLGLSLMWLATYLVGAFGLSSTQGAQGLGVIYLLAWSLFCLFALGRSKVAALLGPKGLAMATGWLLANAAAVKLAHAAVEQMAIPAPFAGFFALAFSGGLLWSCAFLVDRRFSHRRMTG
jgi:peptidoglycan biosynthesis protein MviN/MurJ (putative lipid II flippase)